MTESDTTLQDSSGSGATASALPAAATGRHQLQEPFWLTKLYELGGIDYRSLAAFRIVMAALVLIDLAMRARDLSAMYTGAGVMSIENAHAYLSDKFRWSLHLLDGSYEYQVFLFIAAAVAAVMMLLGWQTRLATIATWGLLLSLQNRTPLVTNGGDLLFRMLIFWSIFTPLGARWSIDAIKRPLYGVAFSPGCICLMLQLCLLYWFTGNYKYNTHWLHGTALEEVFRFDIYGRPLAAVLVEYPTLCWTMTMGTVGLELVGPWLVWSPLFTRWVRLAMVAAFVSFHIGIELTMTVGLFSWVSIAGWLVFLPPVFWDNRLADSVKKKLAAWVPFAAPDRQRPYQPRWYERAPALNISVFITAQTLCVLLMGYTVLWNFYELGGSFKKMIPAQVKVVGNVTGLRQKWNMFGVPPRRNGWFAGRAELKNGKVVDLLSGGGKFTLEKPAIVSATFPNHRWRKMFRSLVRLNKSHHRRYRDGVAEYLVRRWNETHSAEEQVVEFKLYYLSESVTLPRKADDLKTEVFATIRPAEADDGAG